jgi:hypothetical protein
MNDNPKVGVDVGLQMGSFGLRLSESGSWEVFFRSDPKEVLATSERRTYAALCCDLLNGAIQLRS